MRFQTFVGKESFVKNASNYSVLPISCPLRGAIKNITLYNNSQATWAAPATIYLCASPYACGMPFGSNFATTTNDAENLSLFTFKKLVATDWETLSANSIIFTTNSIGVGFHIQQKNLFNGRPFFYLIVPSSLTDTISYSVTILADTEFTA